MPCASRLPKMSGSHSATSTSPLSQNGSSHLENWTRLSSIEGRVLYNPVARLDEFLMSKHQARLSKSKNVSRVGTLIIVMAIATTGAPAQDAENNFGPNNPFYAESTLPFHAPPF